MGGTVGVTGGTVAVTGDAFIVTMLTVRATGVIHCSIHLPCDLNCDCRSDMTEKCFVPGITEQEQNKAVRQLVYTIKHSSRTLSGLVEK